MGDVDWIMRRFRQSRFSSFTISQTFHKLKMSYIPDMSCAIWPYQIVETITQFATCFIAEDLWSQKGTHLSFAWPVNLVPRVLSLPREGPRSRMVAAGHVSMHAMKEKGVSCKRKQALRMGYSAICFLIAWGGRERGEPAIARRNSQCRKLYCKGWSRQREHRRCYKREGTGASFLYWLDWKSKH